MIKIDKRIANLQKNHWTKLPNKEEIRQKISNSLMGRTSWNKGIKMKRRENLIGKRFGRLLVVDFAEDYALEGGYRSARWKCRCDCGNITYQISGVLKGGRVVSCKCFNNEKAKEMCKNRIGEKSPVFGLRGERSFAWKKELTKEEREDNKRRLVLKNLRWPEMVKERDNFICQICGIRGGKLVSHHLNSYTKYKNERYNLNNGITFCKKCHTDFHKKYGIFTTKENYFSFKDSLVFSMTKEIYLPTTLGLIKTS